MFQEPTRRTLQRFAPGMVRLAGATSATVVQKALACGCSAEECGSICLIWCANQWPTVVLIMLLPILLTFPKMATSKEKCKMLTLYKACHLSFIFTLTGVKLRITVVGAVF